MKHALVAMAACVTWVGHSQAAVITWGAATNVSSSTDVSTTGTLLYAINYGSATSEAVNGVTFAAGGTTTGHSPYGQPAAVTGTPYGAALNTGDWNLATVTLTGLTSGEQYEVQAWFNDQRGLNLTMTLSTVGGNSVVLDDAGQFSIGTFTAGATTQSFSVAPSQYGSTLNMLQVRNIPEPTAALLGGLGLLTLLRRRRND